MMRGVGPGLIAGACCAALLACAAGRQSAMSPVASQQDAGAMAPQSPEHDEIARLDSQIDAELTQRSLPRADPASCSGASCLTTARAVPMGSLQRVEGPSCKAPVNDTCKDTCTMADSICRNADRICVLAKQLDNDAWANEKCVKSSESCAQSNKRCCSCL
jgi:hypothetical protein